MNAVDSIDDEFRADGTAAVDSTGTRIAFLVSLPRSGSTLLQRMLSVSDRIACDAEPWAMLPFWGARDPTAGRSVYFHDICATAVDDFLSNIPNGDRAYARAVGAFARTLYREAAAGRPIYLDKTPRYYLMLPLLRQALPDANFVLLLRNPLAVLASICETFNKGRFIWYEYWLDWIEGHRCMAAAVRRQDPGAIVVRYEDVATRPEASVEAVCRHIGVSFDPAMVSDYRGRQISGTMGDPVGIHRYCNVSAESVWKWQDFFDTGYRRKTAARMLRMLDPDDLETLGYPLDELLASLSAKPERRSVDIRSRVEALMGSVAHAIDYKYLQARWRARRAGNAYAYGYYRSVSR